MRKVLIIYFAGFISSQQLYLTDMAFGLFITDHYWQIITSISALYLARKIVVYNRLRKFHSPPLTGFTNFFHNRALIGRFCYEWYANVSEKYGEYPSTNQVLVALF
jgi:hypothetical protein